jgi:hypothetical protein
MIAHENACAQFVAHPGSDARLLGLVQQRLATAEIGRGSSEFTDGRRLPRRLPGRDAADAARGLGDRGDEPAPLVVAAQELALLAV